MLFYDNLEDIVFTRHELIDCDELVIISGYIGPTPIHRLKELPIKSTVVYGMYGCEGIQRSLHTAVCRENDSIDSVNVLYSKLPVHAKCYIWRDHGDVRQALVGSANFSRNGLCTPFKEVLADASRDTFRPLNNYLNMIFSNTIPCGEAVVKENKRRKKQENAEFDPNICAAPLYATSRGVMYIPERSGLNWGHADANVNIADAYLPIRREQIRNYPNLFPQKQEAPTESETGYRQNHRNNDAIEILWDDGTVMSGLLEGTQEIDGIKYPKQVSTALNKAALGKYIRNRIGVSEDHLITMQDLIRYGRNTIDISLQSEGVYYFDFSV